jgi:phage tail-like protein
MIGASNRTVIPQFDRVPPIPEPPFDPTSLLIDERSNWRLDSPASLVDVDVSRCDGSLSLSPSPLVRRTFTEPSGSFGGLVPPSNIAIAPGGGILLLNRTSRRLERFDPCCCEFVDLPCGSKKPGGGPRDLRHPGGIAVCGDRLYIADTGRDGRLASGTNSRRNGLRAAIRRQNHRVSVFLLPGFELAGHLRPSRQKYPHWRPIAVACDRRQCVWVLDRLNGVVHRFTRLGHATSPITGLDQPEQLTIDRHGRIYIVDRSLATGDARLRIFEPSGAEQPAPDRVSLVADAFPALPFVVNANGTVSLDALCTMECPPESATFGPDGKPTVPPVPAGPPLVTSGTYQSSALDSRTRECQWHRLILHGDVPLGTRVRVETFCADEEHEPAHIAGLALWARNEIAPSSLPGWRPMYECLILSPPGRYLWLKLTLFGNGTNTPVVRALEIEFPRLSSLRYLPAVFSAEPVGADFTARFLSLYDTTLRGIERVVDTEARLFDPASTPAARVGSAPVDFLTWLASWVGITFDRAWPEARRRRFLKNAGKLFARRGTVEGLRQQLLQVLGWDPPRECGPCARPRRVCCEPPLNCAPEPVTSPARMPPLILEHFRLRRWLHLGIARLGAQAVLWGERIVNRSRLDGNAQVGCTQLISTPDPKRDPFHVYAHRFSVFVPACAGRSDTGRKWIDNLLRRESPAHTQWDVVYVEPRFRIGVQSMIGFDAVVGALPPPARLGSAKLGGPTLVAGARRSGLRVGRTGRVGTGSQLN